MKNNMFIIGECRICGTGPLGLRACGHCGVVVVLCDECDAVWTDANVAAKPLFSHDPELPCPQCSESLWNPPAHWASREEIDALSWLAEAIQSEKLVLIEGEALSPPEDDEEEPTVDV